jgi:pimeloyl-ACP methyl ester carboxylesterase
MVDPYDLEHVCEALKELVGTGPAVIVGHSMGGFVALEAYARHPGLFRAMALCFTSPSFGGSSGEFARQFVEARILPLDQGRSMDDIASKLMPMMRGARSDPEGLALARRTMATVPPETYRKAVKLLTTFDRRAQLPSIAVPTLLVAGSDDKTAPASTMERMAQKIPGSQYVLLEGCGHLGPMDQPEPFNAALLGFLQKHAL